VTLPFGLDVALGPVPVAALAAVPVIILLAYTVFGLTGFGSAVVASPLLAHIFPLAFVVPLQLLLDFSASVALGTRVRDRVNRAEIARIAPFMLGGMAIGVTLLVNLPGRVLVLLLGVFVVVYGLVGLFGRVPSGRLGGGWAVPISVFGGIVSALFGTGGPIYVIYLSRRIADPAALRATITAVVLLSAFARLALFGFAGLFARPGLVALAVLLLPVMAFGVALGMRLHKRLAPARVRKAVYGLLVANGLSLVGRGL